jgi:hypothetical protein
MSQKIEQAVNKVGKALGELVKAFEQAGAQIDEEHANKVFAFLGQSLNGVQQKALLARQVSIATTGRFSLDMDLPTAGPALIPVLSPVPAAFNPPTSIAFVPGPNTTPATVMPGGKLVLTSDDDELAELSRLTGGAVTLPPDFSGGDETPTPPRRKPREWRPPAGRLVKDAGGTVIFDDEEERRVKIVKLDPTEVPDPKTGGIADAGFIDD